MKKLFIAFLLFSATLFGLTAKTTYYERGDTSFSFSAGVSFPLFISFTGNDTKSFETDTHLSLSGYGTLSYQGFASRNLAIGGKIGYLFGFDVDRKLHTQVPLTVRLSWYAVQTGKADLIISADAGIGIMKYDNSRILVPQFELTLTPVYYITESWGIGLNAGLYANMELYFSSSAGEKRNENAIGAFLPLCLAVIYRH